MGKEIARRLYFMGEDRLLTDISLYSDGTVEFINYTENIIERAFGVRKSPVGVWDLEEFLKYRCFPETRANCKELLKALGLEFYEVFSIVEKTHGVMVDDIFWVKFEGENLTYRDVLLQAGLQRKGYTD